MSTTETELQKEFELERMILFSDAVFAIAITLLIIEVKFPELHKGLSGSEIMMLFKPTLLHFMVFVVSFFFIGLMWARHLSIFKYLRSYNSKVILYNLIFLFFIVCLPFSTSGFTEFRPSLLLPLYICLCNFAFVAIAQYALCFYIFKTKQSLSLPGHEAEKNFLLLQSKYAAIVLFLTATVMITLAILFPDNKLYALYGFYVFPILAAFVRKRLRKDRLAIRRKAENSLI